MRLFIVSFIVYLSAVSVNGIDFEWLFSDTESENEDVQLSVSKQTKEKRQQLKINEDDPVYEMKSAEEKFLIDPETLKHFSELDICHHKV